MSVPKIPGQNQRSPQGRSARWTKTPLGKSLMLAMVALMPPLAAMWQSNAPGPGAARTFADVALLPQHRPGACPVHPGETGCRLSDFISFYGLTASADRSLAGRLESGSKRYDRLIGIKVEERQKCRAGQDCQNLGI